MPIPGGLVDVRVLDPELCPEETRRGYGIRYRSAGRITSGSVFLPYSTGESAAELPLLTWAHCFVGLDHHNAPSAHGLPGVERRHVSHWLARGFAVAAADYRGLDGCGVNPFPRSDEIAHDILDICPAAAELDEGIGDQVIAGGFCQGAAVVAYAASVAAESDFGMDYRGSISLSPPDYVSYFTQVTQDADFPADALVLALLAGIRVHDDTVRPQGFLTPKGSELFEAATALSVAEMRHIMAPYTVRDLGIRDLTLRVPVAAALAQASVVPRVNTSPYFLATIEADPLTPRASIDTHIAAVSAQGAEVTRHSYPGRHLDILKTSAPDAVEWATECLRPRISHRCAAF